MADHTVTITTEYSPDFGGRYFIYLTSNSSPTLYPTDDLRFKWTTHIGSNPPTSVSVSGFEASAFENNSSALTFTSMSETEKFKTVKAGATNQADVISISAIKTGVSNTPREFTANVASSTDVTPAAFQLGDPVTSANPNAVYYAQTVTVEDITVGQTLTAQVTGQAEISTNFSSWTVGGNRQVQLGDEVHVRIKASGSYGVQLATELSIGTVKDTWSVTTKTQAAEKIIQFHHTTGNVPLTDIRNFFAGSLGPGSLDSYRKTPTGLYVPDISPYNNSITTNTAVNLHSTHFRGSATTLYFQTEPPTKAVPFDVTAGGTNTFTIDWNEDTDFTLGYGPNMNDIAEYKFQIIEQNLGSDPTGNHNATDVTIATANTSWSTNGFCTLSVTKSGSSEVRYNGYVRIFARHPADTSIEIFTDVFYLFNFYNNN